jgi:hypothetical protein
MIVKEDDNKKTGSIVFLKVNDNKFNYYVIKGQKNYILNKLKKDNANVKDILHIYYEPNPSSLWHSIVKNIDIKNKCNKFNLNNMSKTDFKNLSESRSN